MTNPTPQARPADTTATSLVSDSEAARPLSKPPRGPKWVLVAGTGRHRLFLLACAVVALLFLALGSQLPDYRLSQLTSVFIMAIAVSGLNLVTGYTGLLSIGHSALFGLGAYTTGVLVVEKDLVPVSTIPVAAVLGFLVGAFVGFPAIRIRGLYLALVTLAVGVAFPEIIRRFENLTGGAAGMVIRTRLLTPPEWTGLTRGQRGLWMYWLSALLLIIVMLLCHNLVKSRFGLAMQATRDNEIAATAQGVDIARTKVLAFAASGGITAAAGSLFAMHVGALSPDGSFTLLKSIEMITGLVLGGVATIVGPVVGAIAVVFLPYLTGQVTTGPLSGVIFGALLIAIVFVMPEGIVGRLKRWLARVLVVVPADDPRYLRTFPTPNHQRKSTT